MASPVLLCYITIFTHIYNEDVQQSSKITDPDLELQLLSFFIESESARGNAWGTRHIQVYFMGIWSVEYIPPNSSKSSQKTLNYLFNEQYHYSYNKLL